MIAGRFQRVVYRCSAEVLPYVERAVGRAPAEEQIEIEILSEEVLAGLPTAPEASV